MLAHQILSDSMPVTNPTHKTCTKCHQTKLLCEFGNAKNYKYGVKAACKVCERKRVKLWRLENPQKEKAMKKNYKTRNREKVKESHREWRRKNKHKKSLSNKIYYENNKTASYIRSANRRAIKKLAFPVWARTGEIKERIDAIYREAKDLELFHQTTYHVDHVIPLQSNFVCGLHVPANLQPLPGVENISKSNSFIPYIESSSEIEIDMVELRKMVKEFIADLAQSNFLD